MSEQWDGKTKGGLLGYKIFVFFIKRLGLRAAYFLLLFVSFWFALFSVKGSKAQYRLFRQQLQYGFFRSVISVLRNNYIFGMILIDKVAVLSGLKHKFTTEHINADVIKAMISDKTGGILVNAHIGSWEIAGQLLEDYGGKICILMFDEEKESVKRYMSTVETENPVRIIPIKEDGSHMMQISEILREKGILVMHGDRFREGVDTITHTFLGKQAKFPSGPYHLAAKFGVPVSFATAFREKNRHYRFYAMKPVYIDYPGNIKARKKEICEKSKLYIEDLEKMVRKYPLQWFNYYDFWAT
jgi:predicted LPLAT superfamily acyltransferase